MSIRMSAMFTLLGACIFEFCISSSLFTLLLCTMLWNCRATVFWVPDDGPSLESRILGKNAQVFWAEKSAAVFDKEFGHWMDIVINRFVFDFPRINKNTLPWTQWHQPGLGKGTRRYPYIFGYLSQSDIYICVMRGYVKSKNYTQQDMFKRDWTTCPKSIIHSRLIEWV